jgi:uncharacterized protein (TIGR02996 family)
VTDGDALIRSILANPSDDAPRLVYADWLEEHGRAEYAEFIRVQVELAGRGFGGGLHTDEQGRLLHMPPDIAGMWARQFDLFEARDGWPDLPTGMADWPLYPVKTQGTRVRVRRGFVERLSCQSGDFMSLAAELFARQPVTHVRLVDLQPAWERHDGVYVWDTVRPGIPPYPDHWVPAPLWAVLFECGSVTYETADEADNALALACVQYGRGLVGLPDLPT